MSSTLDKLIRMANQIATNLEARGEAAAIDETASHIDKYWDPRMRKAIDAHVVAGGAGLSPIALAALRKLESSAV